MPRRVLDAIREQLIDTGFLTRAELRGLKYWHEDKLRDTLAMFEVIAEVEAEFEEPEPADESGYDYYAESLDDDYGYEDLEHEYEVIIEGGNTNSLLGGAIR